MTKTISDHIGRRPVKGEYGIEIEAEFTEPWDEGVVGWHTTGDGSLRGFGTEFISERPWPKKLVEPYVEELYNKRGWRSFRASTRAGIHVHRNVSEWSHHRLLRFFLSYYLVEELMLEYCGPDRKSNLFCLRMNDADEVGEAIKLVVDEKFGYLREGFNRYKYAALNVASVSKLGSVEFRALPSNHNLRELTEWVDMIDKLCEYSEKEQTLEEVYEDWESDRVGFARKVLGWLPRDCDLYDLLDTNRSNAYRIISLYNSRDERKKVSKKKVKYSFPSSEVNVDIGEEMFSYA